MFSYLLTDRSTSHYVPSTRSCLWTTGRQFLRLKNTFFGYFAQNKFILNKNIESVAQCVLY